MADKEIVTLEGTTIEEYDPAKGEICLNDPNNDGIDGEGDDE